MKNGIRYQAVVLFGMMGLLAGINACSEDDPGQDINFDRTSMLTSLADGLIIPNFMALQASVNELSVASANFNANSTEESLALLRAAWIEAVSDFQYTSTFAFGPGNLSLGTFPTVLGVFPIDEAQVETNILDASFNLSASFDRDVRGFYAIEYLIFGKNQTEEGIVADFDQNRKEYLSLIVAELKTTFDEISEEWNATYRSEFIANDGTSAGSSISLLFNAFVKDYENLKNFKVELPAGLTAGQTTTEPTRVEAYYSGISTRLIKAHFENSVNIWKGSTISGDDLKGFEEYLNEVMGGPELVIQTKLAINAIEEAINNLPDGRLSENVEAAEVKSLRDLLQANTPNFKSSMSSLLGISITFNSGDGD